MPKRKSICIFALSVIARDGRVLRQIEYLAPHYDLTVVGYGAPPAPWEGQANVRWVQLPQPLSLASAAHGLSAGQVRKLRPAAAWELRRLAFRSSLLLGQLWPSAYATGYALRWHGIRELDELLAVKHDAYHANDWDTLLLAAKAAQRHHARLVVDLHEYAPLQFENQSNWWLFEPMIRAMLRRYAVGADASLTVTPEIAERYQREFGLEPLVVLNAPDTVALPPKTFDPQNIRLVHHGSTMAARKPEWMIETIARCDARYTLHLMLLPAPYVAELQKLAEQLAPGRVFFHPPVPPAAIVPTIAQFDVGFNLIAPTNYNYLMSLPNKFFESIAAGLAVCIGPSPAMANLVKQYGFGCIAPSFAPEDIAATLNQVSTEQWLAMQQAARTTAQHLNAATEMAKLVQLYARLLEDQ
ncbi:MAG: glycosyltransferase [Caldilineaceae bacterium]